RKLYLPVQIKRSSSNCKRDGATSASARWSNGAMPLLPGWADSDSAVGRALATEGLASAPTNRSTMLLELLRSHWLDFAATFEQIEFTPALHVDWTSWTQTLVEQERDTKRSFLAS